MKKHIILLFLQIGFSFSASSQVKFTPTVGVNFATCRFTNGEGKSKISTDRIYSFSNRTGYVIGVNLEISMTGKSFFSPGIFYQNMGHKSNLSIPESDFGFTPGFDAYFDVSLHYLHMPLNFGFSFPVGEDFKLQIMAGSYLSYFLKGRDKVQISGYSKGVTIYHVDESREMKPGKNPLDNNDKIEYVNPLDLGLNGSLSLVMSNKFTLGLNYLFGISNILPFYKEEPTGYNRSDFQKYRNSVFSIRFGYSILNPDK